MVLVLTTKSLRVTSIGNKIQFLGDLHTDHSLYDIFVQVISGIYALHYEHEQVA